MTGQIKKMLDRIIEARSQGNPTIALTTRTKLVLKGIDPEKYGTSSPDDPAVMARVKQVAQELGVDL